MSSATVGGVTTNYAYDPTGQRVSETPAAGGDTTFHLQDHNNPTGYPQTLEEKSGSTAATATLARSYLIGLTVLGQSDAAIDTAYFVRDGHGSNRMLIGPDAQGATVILERYDYQAFGDPINFDPQSASTPHLFGGDGEYTKSNNLTYHDARWRNGFTFTSFDSFEAAPDSPEALHKYLYANANPTAYSDPNGNFGIAIGLLNFSASFLRFALDPGRGFTGGWGAGRELVEGLDFGISDPFELAELHQLSRDVQLADIHSEVRRGFAQVAASQQVMWDAWWSVYDDFPLLGDPREVLASFIGVKACFVAGTQIVVGLDSNGSYVTRKIEEISQGDYVLTRSQFDATDTTELRPVSRVFRKTSDHVRVITIRDAAGDEEVIRTTDEHPFWVDDRGWVRAGALSVGDQLNEADDSNDAIVVSSYREAHAEGITVWNFEVAGDHTYFVSDGFGRADVAVWVHNVCTLANGAQIIGKAQVTNKAGALGGTAHGLRSAVVANRMAQSGAYTRVYKNVEWSTILQGRGTSVVGKRYPDVAAVRQNGRIDVVEIASPKDLSKSGFEKLFDRNQKVIHGLRHERLARRHDQFRLASNASGLT